MNEQWSSVGLCVEPQAEQRSLATNQQAALTEDSSRSTVSRSNNTDFQNCPPSSSTNPIDCNSNSAPQTSATRPPSRRQALHANGLQPCSSLTNKGKKKFFSDYFRRSTFVMVIKPQQGKIKYNMVLNAGFLLPCHASL